MSSLNDAVCNRRSVRSYTAKVPVPADIEQIIQAGMWAPSGMNNQPWKFKIISDGELKKGLAEYTKYSKIIIQAPICICVFLDKEVMYDRDKDLMAIGACIENMLLKVYELKLGACWLGEILNRKDEVCEFLGTAKNLELMAVISLGEPAEDPGKGERRPLSQFVLS